jgi:hypothetical protein
MLYDSLFWTPHKTHKHKTGSTQFALNTTQDTQTHNRQHTVCSEHHTRHTNTQQAEHSCHWVKRLVQQEIKLQKVADRCDCKSSLITIFQGNNQIKVKVKCTLVQALRLCTRRTAYRWRRGIALLFHDHGTRKWRGVSVTPWPLFTPGKDPVSIVQGWVGSRAGLDRCGKSRTHRDSIPGPSSP